MSDTVSKVLRLYKNPLGRDFVVGDIHGCFDLLEKFYQVVNFDKSRDRLLSVGDVIDRGPDSLLALEYVDKPWFYLVRGNHEEMLIESQKRVYGMYELWMNNGGEWSDQATDAKLSEMADYFQTLPYIIEVDTDHGKVGIVHADMPDVMPWDETLAAVESGKLKDKDLKVYLWARETYRKLRMSLEYPGAIQETTIEGVHKIYVGHSITKRPAAFGNMMFIDTGAYTNGTLTFVELGIE
ncbi:MAG TPA: phosphoprotein phosphatase, partial [Gammaproteobacteria bacterium]|nr:phosphoprotein phosphatase [Gammaproteobacteria bacterium]